MTAPSRPGAEAGVDASCNEGLKEKGALMLIPSSAVESMSMGGMLGAAALRQQKLAGGSDPGEKGQ